ncbi:MAG: hypothetical protein IBJ11_09150 [Phycisphaerales bacterium]|nr:hypothetical protein [Phycisphaerales bacterium]
MNHAFADSGLGRGRHAEVYRTRFVVPEGTLAQLGGPGGGQKGPPQDDKAAQEKLKAQQRAAIQKRIDALTKELARVEDELRKKGFNSKGEKLESAKSEGPEDVLAPLTDAASTKVTVWAHDFTAEPGAAYRYKVRVHLTNPFFGFVDRLSEAQKPLAAAVSMATPDSEWTGAVDVPADTQYFVSTASAPDGRAAARASVDVYRFYYGYWRHVGVNVDAGDGVRGTVELPANLPIFTIVPGENEQPPKLDADKTKMIEDRKKPVDVARQLVDVGRGDGPAGQAPAADVLLATEGGDIEVRVPAGDRVNPLRGPLERSVLAAKTAVVREPGIEMGGGTTSSGASTGTNERGPGGSPPPAGIGVGPGGQPAGGGSGFNKPR